MKTLIINKQKRDEPVGFAVVKITNINELSIWAITDELRSGDHVEILGFAKELHKAELIRDKILFDSAITESETILKRGRNID
ncbi:MAG: hypothetical protein ACR2PP_09940 [Psychrobacter sp.]